MKILVTGSNGFVGRNVFEYYQAKYKEVYAPKRAELNLTDFDAVTSYLNEHKFDVVIHCGVTLLSVEQNLNMYFNLERNSSVFGKMICVGSGADYDKGRYQTKIVETDFGKFVPKADDIYSFSKYVIAKDIESVHRNIYNMRVFGIFGKYEDYTRRFISNNICRALTGLEISMNRNMLFDYLYIDDFLRMLDIFVHQTPKLRSYNTCCNESVDFKTLAKLIAEAHDKEVGIVVKQEGMNPEYAGDNSLFQEEFGPFEFTDFKTSIGELYHWYKHESGLDLKPELFA